MRRTQILPLLVVAACYPEAGDESFSDQPIGKADDPAVEGACAAPAPGSLARAHVFRPENADERFGFAVEAIGDIDGDCVDEFAIGAPGLAYHDDDRPGSVYVYSGATLELLFTATGDIPGGGFGHSIAATGDVDGDGAPDFLVGAPWAGEGWVLSGGRDGEPIHRLTGGETAGFSVAAVGDVDGDGLGEFALAGPWHDAWCGEGLGGTGAVWLFSGASGDLFRVIEGFKGDWLGYSVAAVGDVDGDGHADIAAGAPREVWSNQGYEAGAIVLLDGAVEPSCAYGRWDALAIERGYSGGDLGAALAGIGDIDGDGFGDLVAGAPGMIGGKDGHARVMTSSGSVSWLEPFNDRRSHFGRSVHGPGDIDGDGVPDIAVGAPVDYTSTSPYESGVVHLFSGADQSRLAAIAGPSFRSYLGQAISSGERGQGCKYLLASTGQPHALSGNGVVYLYQLPCPDRDQPRAP